MSKESQGQRVHRAWVTLAVIAMMTASTAACGTPSMEEFAVGTWSCSSTRVHDREAAVEIERVQAGPPFDSLLPDDGEADLRYDLADPARPRTGFDDHLTGLIAVHPGGTFRAEGEEYLGGPVIDGRWLVQDGMVFVTVHTHDENRTYALDVEIGADGAALLDIRRERIYELNAQWGEQMIDYSMTAGRGSYVIACDKLSDNPSRL